MVVPSSVSGMSCEVILGDRMQLNRIAKIAFEIKRLKAAFMKSWNTQVSGNSNLKLDNVKYKIELAGHAQVFRKY